MAVSNLVECRPGLMWGQPVIRGTRIPTWRIAELVLAGVDPTTVYPRLSELDVAAAVAYERGELTDNKG